jgi:hypothetical protein
MKKFTINKGLVCTSVVLVTTGTVLGVVTSNNLKKYENRKVTPEININGLSHSVSYHGILQLKASANFPVSYFE